MLISKLGNFIFKQALLFLNQLDDLFPGSHLKVSINVSILELLRGDYIDHIKNTVKECHISPKRIELEVTESVFEEKFDLANSIMGDLRRLGFTVALDDFGKGYSSFYRLREMNMDTIKIDKCFVDKINKTNTDEFIIDEIIALSHKLGLKVVGEGVESIEQVIYLKANMCDFLQGYYLSKPLKAPDLIRFIKAHSLKD
ncbi:EAL domain-containing protein [Mycoplasmatota bacterium]|nr:EAL domain-containing protein [Mycoplasmatota bacterium]